MLKKRGNRRPRALTLRKIFKKINSFDNSSIYYFVSKNNKSSEFLVLIHGIGCNNSLLRYEESFFIYNKLNVINVDLRGHGFSENLKGKISLEDFARDIYFILKEEKATKVFLVGYSLGGFVSLKFYSLFPQFVKKMVMIDASYAINLKTLRPIFIFSGLFLFGLIILPMRAFSMHIKQDLDFSKYKWRKIFSILPLFGISISLKNLSYAINAMIKEDLSHVLEEIKVPTLILEDKRDFIFSKKSFNIEHEKISQSKLKIIEGRHLSVLIKSEAIELEILNFIKSN